MSAEIISTSIRIILFSVVNYGIATFVVNATLDKKRSLWALCLYWAGKILLQGVLNGYVFQQYYGDAQWLQIISVSSTLIFSVVNYGMFYITFKGGMLKVAMAALIGEITCAFLGYLTLASINILEGKEDVWTFLDVLQPMDFLAFVVSGGLLFFFYHYAAPYLRKFKHYELKHRKLLWTLFLCYIAVANVTVLLGADNMTIVGVIVVIVGFLYIAGLCFVVIKYQKSLTMKRSFMQGQQKITEAHYEAVQGQIHKMEQSQQRVDEQMKEIIRLQDHVVDSERLKVYLAGLRKSYEDIRAGIYCDNWRIDALIYSQAQMLEKSGIAFDCSIQDGDMGGIREDDFIQMLLVLLNLGAELNRAVKAPEKKRVWLHTAAVKNQLVIDFASACGDKRRISKSGIRAYLRKYHGQMSVEKGEDRVDIRLTLQSK